MRHTLLLLAALPLAAGTAAAQTGPSVDPPLNAAFDSAAVVLALAALPTPPGAAPLVELRFDSTGTFRGVEAVGSSGPAEYVRALRDALRRHSRDLAPRTGGYGILATVAGGAAPMFAAPALVARAPSLANSAALRRMLRELHAAAREEGNWEAGIGPGMSEASPGSPARPRPSGRLHLELRLRVLADGSVGEAWLHRRSGRPKVDTEALRAARNLRFHPGRVRDNAVPMYVLLPVTIPY